MGDFPPIAAGVEAQVANMNESDMWSQTIGRTRRQLAKDEANRRKCSKMAQEQEEQRRSDLINNINRNINIFNDFISKQGPESGDMDEKIYFLVKVS